MEGIFKGLHTNSKILLLLIFYLLTENLIKLKISSLPN
jgi:hypothetical protein